MKIKPGKSFIVTIVVLLLVGGRLWYGWNKEAHAPVKSVSPEQDTTAYFHPHLRKNGPAPTPPLGSNQFPHNLGFRQKANEMSDAEMRELAGLFVTKLKPAAEKWFSVYSNRVPFNLADLGMDKFVERFGRDSKVYHSYTFVVGDITLGIAERDGDAQVQYLASKRAVATMQTPPTTGVAPDVSMPVTPQQVLAMAEADSGQEFAPNLVQLIPSAESGSLAGGAVANVGSEVKNAVGIPISKVSAGFNYVFAKDGTLAYYLRAK